jgi:hypothetical protein
MTSSERDIADDHLRWALHHRGVETPCDRCRGLGVVTYASTSTWRGGMGGASMTRDVCDVCWGSGDAHDHWTDLRKLRAEEDHRVHARAGELFKTRLGVELRSLLPALDALAAELDAFSRQRRPRPQGFDTVTRCLAHLLRDLVGAKRIDLAAEAERAARRDKAGA